MASIFTYDPDPPRVSSPWSTPDALKPSRSRVPADGPPPSPGGIFEDCQTPPAASLADCGVTRLEAEPQAGPTEYKLHLLLRSRRAQNASSAGHGENGALHVGSGSSQLQGSSSAGASTPGMPPAPSTTPSQSRQLRLQQLTTQLLWRLQQSSPYHTATTTDLVLPVLPDATPVLGALSRPGRLLPGLEESHGALYEIGVSDDGTFVGLTKDEMAESLNNLRAMAASLGCDVRVLRMVAVGEHGRPDSSPALKPQSDLLLDEKLWVAEALVKPDLQACNNSADETDTGHAEPGEATAASWKLGPTTLEAMGDQSPTEQLRVSFTGGTTSGKSSLLGTLSTATLDNGRGKSRLSLLKHRHEMVSGVTSSVAQELIGYRRASSSEDTVADVINYASGNVSSWIDMHAACASGRLVFCSDSAGHPRYRRTTVRGLVGWVPHWDILCIAADDMNGGVMYEGQDRSSLANTKVSDDGGNSTSMAYLELCLELHVPLLVAITKLDLASKTRLRQALTRILSTLKAAGRRPVVLSAANSTGLDTAHDVNLQVITRQEQDNVERVLEAVKVHGSDTVVPIVLSSAVTGMGMGTVHALLRGLPIPNTTNERGSEIIGYEAPKTLYHIEEIFALPASAVISNTEEASTSHTLAGAVVSGHVRYGQVAIGDELFLGPFPAQDANQDGDRSIREYDGPTSLGSPLFGSDDKSPFGGRRHSRRKSAMEREVEWQKIRVISIRNLRLPVRKLLTDQVGTIGIVQVPNAQPATPEPTNSTSDDQVQHLANGLPGLRKGFVLIGSSPLGMNTPAAPASYSGFTGLFSADSATSVGTGSLVVIYIASVRASAKMASIRRAGRDSEENGDAGDVFDFDGDSGDDRPGRSCRISFRFTSAREWIEVGTPVLVMPGGAAGFSSTSGRAERGAAGLESFVGKIIDAIE